MNNEPFDFAGFAHDLFDFLVPFSETMNSIERSFSLEADVQIIDKWYSVEDRQKITNQLEAAWLAERDASDKVEHVIKRGDDLRTIEQYALEHGDAVAQKAFTPYVLSLWENAKKEINAIQNAHPLIYRIHCHVKGRDY